MPRNSDAQDGAGRGPQPRAPLLKDSHTGSRVVPKIPPSPHSRSAKVTDGQRAASSVPSLRGPREPSQKESTGNWCSCSASIATRRPGPTHHVGIPERLVSAGSLSGGSRCQGPRVSGFRLSQHPHGDSPSPEPRTPGRRQAPANAVTPTKPAKLRSSQA